MEGVNGGRSSPPVWDSIPNFLNKLGPATGGSDHPGYFYGDTGGWLYLLTMSEEK